MLKKNQSIINSLNMLSDFIVLFIAYFISLYLRFVVFGGKVSLILWRWPFVLIPFVYSAFMVVAFYGFRMYGSYRFNNRGDEIISIAGITAMGTLFLMATFFIWKISDFSRGVVFLYWCVSTTLIILKRYIIRGFLKHTGQFGYSKKHVVIVGNGRHAFQYIQDITRNPYTAITVDGYVSKVQKEGLGECLGSYEDLENILQEREIDELVVALEAHEIEYMKEVIACADKEGVRLSLIPFFNEYFPTHTRMEIIGSSKLIDMRATPLDNILSAGIKRLIDICGSLFGIIFLSPVMVAVAIGVKVSSPGPALFGQDRIGKDKKPFRMLKFRSMKVNSTETTGWSTNADKRKTRFGSIIRKYSIDELPQLFNVLKGDMSLVGPRPEVPHYVRQFKEDVPLYLLRQQVKPGMTGWAQIHGLRGDTSIEDRVKYDIWYIENWSLGLDIKILLKTVFGGFKNNEVIISNGSTKEEETV